MTAQALLDALGSPDSELSLVFTDDVEIAGLNEQYRHRQGPTNVLAFPMHEGDFSDITPQLLGDVVISVETAAQEGESLGLTLSQRLDFLLIHGILHLFGYDHETGEAGQMEMDRKTEQLYKIIKTKKEE